MWKDIRGFEGIYSIDEYGNIKNNKSNKLIKPYLSNKGYKLIDLYKNKKKYKFSVHKLVAINFVPNPNNYPIVLHKDNIKTNTYYKNLIWGTYSENNKQAIKDGLNKVPTPDNRKYYEICNGNKEDRIVCFGVNEVVENIGYGNNGIVRNLLFREDKIKTGLYQGYKVRKIIKPIIIKPISFNNLN